MTKESLGIVTLFHQNPDDKIEGEKWLWKSINVSSLLVE